MMTLIMRFMLVIIICFYPKIRKKSGYMIKEIEINWDQNQRKTWIICLE